MVQMFASAGPVARSVADLALMYDVIRAGDARDPGWVPAGDTDDAGPPSVAVTVDPAGEGVHPDVRDAVRRAADALANAGHPVTEVDPPKVGAVSDTFRDLVATEIAKLRYAAIQRFGSDGTVRFVDTLLELSSPYDLAGYATALAERRVLCAEWSLFLQQHPVVLGPVSTQPTWPVGFDQGGPDAVAAMFAAHRLTVAANVLALPAAVVSAGLSPAGVPLGVQLITAPFAERRALAAAAAVEHCCPPVTPIDPRP